MDLGRYHDVLAWLAVHAAEDPDVRVVWVGGSAVTGGFDQWSDLDVEVLVAPGSAPDAHRRLLEAARGRFDVHDVWDLPEATHPDGRQSFLSLQDRPGLLDEPTRLLDVSVHALTGDHHRIDVRRHGRPLVVHDPAGLLDTDALEAAARPDAVLDALDQVRQRRVTGEWLVQRAVYRHQLPEATDLHLRFALAPLVRLLRARRCPWRHDFGLRYLAEDLGPELALNIQRLLPEGDLEDQARVCFTWQDELIPASRLVVWPEPGQRVVGGLETGHHPDRVWEALTSPAALARWLGRAEGVPAPDATYTIHHDETVRSVHEVRDWSPGEHLRIGWDFTDEPPGELDLRVSPSGRIVIEHSGADDPAAYAAGWAQHLRFLQAHLDGHPLPWDLFWEGWEERLAFHRQLLAHQERARV